MRVTRNGSRVFAGSESLYALACRDVRVGAGLRSDVFDSVYSQCYRAAGQLDSLGGGHLDCKHTRALTASAAVFATTIQECRQSKERCKRTSRYRQRVR
jgi:hypothetical protein